MTLLSWIYIYAANQGKGEAKQASEVPASHFVDPINELMLADLGSSLITVTETLCAHPQGLRCHCLGFALLVNTLAD